MYETHLNKFNETGITSNYNSMKPEITKKFGKKKKSKHMRLNNMLLKNQWVNEEIKEEIKEIHLNILKNGNTTF